MKNTIFYLLLLTLLLIQSCNPKDTTTNAAPENYEIIEPEDALVRLSDSIAETIRFIIETREPEERYKVNGIELYSSVALPEFYVNREFQAIWLRHSDSLHMLEDMISFISNIKYHGFIPEHYHFESITTKHQLLRSDSCSVFDLAQLEILLSDAFFMISSHLYHGKVNPELLTAEWAIRRNKPELDLPGKLTLMHQYGNVESFMQRFYPPHPGYLHMVKEAKRLDSIQPNDFKSNITLQARQLSIDLEEDSTHNEALYKKLQFLELVDTLSVVALIEGIKHLQKQYGLNQDGKIGKNTLLALDQSVEDKIKSLHVNMERLRWLPDSLNRKHITVNIADFTLDYIVDQDTLLSMRTVVGRNFRQTPVFNARMTYLVFSPTWTVPPGILRNDVIPAVTKDIGYLSKNKMVILDGSGKVVDPKTIDWKKVRAGGSFPYRVRQIPGGHNALGRVKFMFPNKYSVYLHDTPSKELFARDERTFSSGCIRIQKPFELAKLLLESDERWDEERIKQAMYSDKEQSVTFRNPIDVYLFYLTSWGDANGQLHYRQDVYNRDNEVYNALMLKKKNKL